MQIRKAESRLCWEATFFPDIHGVVFTTWPCIAVPKTRNSVRVYVMRRREKKAIVSRIRRNELLAGEF